MPDPSPGFEARLQALEGHLRTLQIPTDDSHSRYLIDGLSARMDPVERRLEDLTRQLRERDDAIAGRVLTTLRRELDTQIGATQQAVGGILKDVRAGIERDTQAKLSGALSDVAVARQLASAPVEVSEALCRDAVHAWALGEGGARASQSRCERAVKGLFSAIDRKAISLTVRIQPDPSPRATAGQILAAMTQRADAIGDPEAEVQSLRDDAEQELLRILKSYDTDLARGDALATIPGHITRGEALHPDLDPSVRAAAITLKRASATGHNVVPLVEDLDHKLLAALSDGRDFRGRMSKRWELGIQVAAANAGVKVLTRAAEVANSPVIKQALADIEQERDELSYQYRITFPRNMK